MDIQQLYRGLLRGLTSDVVGGPADIAEQLANLGLAGYGYAGHKLGLLDASEMPKLLEASPGTSEWFARLAKNPDSGAPEYTAGRFVPAAVGLARAGAPAAQKGLAKAVENLGAPAERGLAQSQRGGIVIPQNTWKGLARGPSANDPEKPLHPLFEARIAAEEANLRALEASPVKAGQHYRYGSDGRFPPGVFEVMEPVRQAGDRGYVWAGLIRQRNPDGTFRTARTELTDEQLLQMGLADLQPEAIAPSTAQRFYGGEQMWLNNPPAEVRAFGPRDRQRGGIDFGEGPEKEKGLAQFRKDFLDKVQKRVAERQVAAATRDFAFQPGAQFLSQKTGYTYTLTGKSVDSKGRSVYSYEGVHPNGDTQKGTFLEERMLSPEGRASMIPLNQTPADSQSVKGLLRQFQLPFKE